MEDGYWIDRRHGAALHLEGRHHQHELVTAFFLACFHIIGLVGLRCLAPPNLLISKIDFGAVSSLHSAGQATHVLR